MTCNAWPKTCELLEAFGEEIAGAGGKVTDTYDDGNRLFVRSILPGEQEVRRKDAIQRGVAMRATAQQIAVHPYTFRLVCQNGAIHAEVIQCCIISRNEETYSSPDRIIEMSRELVRRCGGEEAFVRAAGQMRSALEREADFALNLMPLISRLPREHVTRLLDQISMHFGREEDRSRFGLMNAVTATARTTRDPDLRWRLEEFGGGIVAEPPVGPRSPARLAAKRVLAVV